MPSTSFPPPSSACTLLGGGRAPGAPVDATHPPLRNVLFDVVFGDEAVSGLAMNFLRRQRERAAAQCKRRGSWHPKPRQGEVYGTAAAGVAKDEWEHDPSKSVWNKFFPQADLHQFSDDNDDDDEVAPDFDLQSFAEFQFRREFHVSRPVFYHHLRLLLQSGEFDEKHAGDGTTGRRSHPLHLKLAFSSPSHVCMRTFPTIAARHWCASVNEQ